MTTFVLKKYQEQKPLTASSETDPSAAGNPPQKEEITIDIKASDTVAKIVATALYKAFPNGVDIQEQEDKPTDTNVISKEDINTNPVLCIQNLKKGSNVVIVCESFSTQKEEWFLSTLGNKGVNVFYSIESFIKHAKTVLGV